MPLSSDEQALLGRVGLPSQGALRIPGPTYESAKAAQEVLQENHVKFDWQFTTNGLHNHLSHAILASYSLGASPDHIRDIYKLHSMSQKPMCDLQKNKISFQNWTRWLGKDDYYSSYLVFFTGEIEQYGSAATLERYLFKFKEGKLLIRAVSGAIHPLIQIGHGVEFGLDALVAEGLAQACVHSPDNEPLFPPGWPSLSNAPTSSSPLSSAFSRFGALKLSTSTKKESFSATAMQLDPSRPRHPRKGLSGFTILSHILGDPRLAAGQANGKDDFPRLKTALRKRGQLIRAWCEEWVLDESGGWTEIVEKTEELFWMATVLVGASSRPGYATRLDFFLMHTLTSAIFLPGMLEVLSPSSRIALLHSHFRVMIAYWVSRGRPFLYIEQVLMAATPYPQPPDSQAYETSAIQRRIDKGGTDEVKMRDESLKKQEAADKPNGKDSAQPALVPNGHAQNGDQESKDEQVKSDSSSQVDIPLDSPAEEKPQELFVQELEEEGVRTPRVTQTRSPTPESTSGKGKKQSSAAVWGSIIESVQDHSDEHTTKMARSLAFAAQHFGMAPPGIYASGVPGSHLMDGSIFIRLAGMLMATMGWEHEGQETGSWDMSVLGFDEAWQEETNANAKQEESQQPRKVDKGKGRAVDQDA